MAKKMTATEAAAKLTKAFKLDPPLPNRWSVIFRAAERLGHSARAMINADEGALVQSEALGFSNGGGTFTGTTPEGKKDTFKIGDYYADASKLGNIKKGLLGETSGYTGVRAAPNMSNPGGGDSNEERDRTQAIKQYRDYLVYQTDEEGKTLQNYGTRGDRDLEATAFTREDVAGNPDHPNNKIYSQKLISRGPTVGFTDPDTGLYRALTFNQAQIAKGMGIVDQDETEDTPAETPVDTPAETPASTPITSTPTQSAPAPDMPKAVSLEPSKAEIDRAAEVFVDDAVVLPTGTSDLPSIETPTVEAPEGTTAVDAPTFQANIDRQAEQFKQRGIDQAQLIQPQTRAEKIAAGQTAGRLEQRLYQNRQGMSTYVLGVYNSEGLWTPSQSIPQGYREANVGLAPYLVQQAANAPTTATPTTTASSTDSSIEPMGRRGDLIPDSPLSSPDEAAESLVPRWSQPQKYFGRTLPPGTYAGPNDMIHKFGEGPYAEETSAYLRSIGKTLEEFIASANWEATPTPELTGDPSFATTKNQGGMIRGYQEGGPTVTVAGEELDKEQMAQGQADLTAGAILDPAGTAVAAPVSTINPDAEGTVLGATTGQALGTAPIITDPAQAPKTITADTPDKPDVTKVTTQKAQTGVEDALKDVTGAKSEGPTKTIEAQTQDTTKVSDIEAAQGTAAEAVAAKRELQKGELITDYPDIDASTVDKDQVSEAFGTGEVKAASMQDELTTLMNQFEGGNTPPWAAGAMRKATAVMAQRGLGASSMAGQAIIQAAMEASLPIAQIDTANKQQVALFKGEQRAKFMQMEFDQNFQAKIINASKVSEVANMNFTAEQQVALENAKMAQTMNLANLNNRQALVMAEAAQISQLEMASLNNRQQAQVQNAQNFLQIDMANLNNEQQAEIFKAQTIANTILTDTAAANASEQFNATSAVQVQQFYDQMQYTMSSFNAAQQNAMSQFNIGETNAIEQFNVTVKNEREQFQAKNRLIIAQSNSQWKRDIATIDTATINQANENNAKALLDISNDSYNNLHQLLEDQMEYSWTSVEKERDRINQIVVEKLRTDGTLSVENLRADAQASASFGRLLGNIIIGGFGGYR